MCLGDILAFAGGGADKEGNGYESLWAVLEILRVLSEQAYSIAFERPGVEGEGVEFAVEDKIGTLFYQSKRRNRDNWTLNQLSKEGVLQAFFEKLENPNARCKFVSTNPAYELSSLAKIAKKAQSVTEYCDVFVKGQELNKDFDDVLRLWGNCTKELAWQKLKRIEVDWTAETHLERELEEKIGIQIEGDASSALALLSTYVIKRLYEKKVLATEIWQHLEEHGFKRRDLRKDPRIRIKVDEINRRYLGSSENQTIRGHRIPRTETASVIAHFANSDAKKYLVLSGVAGVGKSGVMLDVYHAMKDEGWEVLAFRLDRLENAQSPKAIGAQLEELPDSPTLVLAELAHGKKAVLMIDQLDAVSLSSGRNPAFFEVVLELIRQAKSHPNLFVLLACRKFDLHNDYRFLKLVANDNSEASEIEIQKLGKPEVAETLHILGLDGNRFSEKQLDLLSIPLHLKLLGESLESQAQIVEFHTVNDLYKLFWERKENFINLQPKHPNWIEVIDCLCKKMSETQTLSIPKISLDGLEHWEMMVSEGVLIRDGNRLAFFHEGFFDYAFARRFAAQGDNLQEMLLSDEQLLLRRGQVRQILTQERDIDFGKYLENLEWLLFDPAVRFHVRQGTIALLVTVLNPQIEEWELVSRLLESDNKYLAREAEQVLRNSQPWLGLLDQHKIFQNWLESGFEPKLNLAFWLLQTMQEFSGKRVAELIKPFLGISEDWNSHIASVFRFQMPFCRESFDIYLTLLQLEAIHEDTFWTQIHDYPIKHPEWTCEAVGVFLNHSVLSKIQNLTESYDGIDLPNNHYSEEVLRNCAEKTPVPFLNMALPFVINVASKTLRAFSQKFQPDAVWGNRFPKYKDEFKDNLIDSMVLALRVLSRKDFDEFLRIFCELRQSELETIQTILVLTLSDAPPSFADEAISFLCEHPERLLLGFSDTQEEASYKLLVAMTPFASANSIKLLETVVFQHSIDWERKPGHGRIFGASQYSLLLGIEASKLTEAMFRRKQELERKFANHQVIKQHSHFGLVGSPIPYAALSKMSDRHILRGMKKYAEDTSFPRWHDDHPVGGARHFATALQDQTQANPERFVHLLLQMPSTVHDSYFRRILEGLEKAEIPLHLVFSACLRCHEVTNKSCGHEITRVVRAVAQRDLEIPVQILELILFYATQDPDPKEDTWKKEDQNSEKNRFPSIAGQAINSVRGKAAETIAAIIWDHPERIEFFRPVFGQMVKDPVIAVRYCVAKVLLGLLRYEPDNTIGLFLDLCDCTEIFLVTNTVERFLHYALKTHFSSLKPLLERMIHSSISEVSRVGARLICVTSYAVEEAEQMAEYCLNGSVYQRLGAADVYASNLKNTRFSGRCEKALLQLFYDPEELVQDEAADCFQKMSDGDIDRLTYLIEKFIQSPAFSRDTHLLYTLEQSAARIPDTILSVCEKFFEITGDEVGNIQNKVAGDAHYVSKLIVRTYAQQLNASIRNPSLLRRTLNLIDRMLENRVYDAEKVLELY
jgi:hypothetical protein